MKRTSLLLLAILPMLFVACEGEKTDTNDSTPNKTEISASGFAQKGQLIKGSSVTAFGLDENLKATGASFPTSITDDLGSFALEAVGDAKYLEYKAEGYYFVENTGKLSSGPIYLQALAQKDEKDVNINLLTTLTVSRIKFLVSTGMEFSKAKQQAQKELLNALNIDNSEFALVDFNDMNIAKGSKADGVLLAISVLLQTGRSTGDILSMIAEISSGFEKTGMISEEMRNAIYANRKEVPLDEIVQNLTDFYKSKNITDYSIPPFFKYVDEDYPDLILYPPLNPENYYSPSEGCEGNFKAWSFIEFSCESDVDWIVPQVEILDGYNYQINYTLKQNPDSRRTGHLVFKDKDGKELGSVEFRQETSHQYIIIKEGGADTKASSARSYLSVGEKVSINGVSYAIPEDRTIEVSEAEAYRIGYPETVTGLERDPYFCTVIFASETTEYDFNLNSSVDLGGASEPSGLPLPRYCALKEVNGEKIPRYADAYLKPCVCGLQIRIGNCSDVYYIVVEGDENAVFSGKASYLYSEEMANRDQSYERHDPIINDASNKVRVNNSNYDSTICMIVMPQSLSYIKVSVYNSQGDLVGTKEARPTNPLQLKVGGIYALNFNI